MQQYRPLWILARVTDTLASLPSPDTLPPSIIRTMVLDLISASARRTNADELPRGKATVPLTGIDIPFHSTALRGQIDDYRTYLVRSIRVEDIRPEELVRRWIPNVVGEVFSVEKDFVEKVWTVTGSEVLGALLAEMREGDPE